MLIAYRIDQLTIVISGRRTRRSAPVSFEGLRWKGNAASATTSSPKSKQDVLHVNIGVHHSGPASRCERAICEFCEGCSHGRIGESCSRSWVCRLAERYRPKAICGVRYWKWLVVRFDGSYCATLHGGCFDAANLDRFNRPSVKPRPAIAQCRSRPPNPSEHTNAGNEGLGGSESAESLSQRS